MTRALTCAQLGVVNTREMSAPEWSRNALGDSPSCDDEVT